MEIKGYGEDISIEAGNVLRYFIEHCTERELELALETTFDNMNIVNVVRFYKVLQKLTNTDWSFRI